MDSLKETSHEANTTTDTSVSSDLRLAKRMKPTVSPTATTKYKGVVQQQNGHWGAQIYADHKRIWLELSNPLLKPLLLTIAHLSSSEASTLTRTGTSLGLKSRSRNRTFKKATQRKLC
ncbi:hypothetical protein Bca52824_064838 [Brassica carinata]|uniref:Uncharacterized protein n=1 Tax=Brassica carinata TaxID=52824 RepID=A0A8X7QIM1_BRACI|nr:hypothetical protein Bca52824_064838 [Brassica carinata]